MSGAIAARIRALDHAATRAVAAAHNRRRTALLLAVTRLGSLRFLLPATLVAAAILILLGRGRSAALLGLAMLGAWAASPPAKRLFRRDRPNLWPALATDSSHSFPSQHSLMAAVFFGGLAFGVAPLLPATGPRVAIIASLAVVVLGVGFSRVYLGAHWTSDVVGGLLIGLLWLAVCAAALTWVSGPPATPRARAGSAFRVPTMRQPLRISRNRLEAPFFRTVLTSGWNDPIMDLSTYDLLVIGSGPAGQKGAIAAAKLGKRVAIIDRRESVGGVCLHTGTIPSKTLREAILYLSGFGQRAFYGKSYSLKDEISVADLGLRVKSVISREVEVVHAQLKRNHVTSLYGSARFLDPNTLEIESLTETIRVRGDHVLIACGTRPAEHSSVPCDGVRIIDSDQLISLEKLPRELIVVGAGVIGLEYASMMTAMNIKVTIIDQRPTILDFVDHEMTDALLYFMRQRGATFRLGEKVDSVETDERGRVVANLASGKQVHGDVLLYTAGRTTNADRLELAAAGISADGRGKIAVNAQFQTSVPHIYAAGDVIGFPSLASTSMEQGRLASCHMFGQWRELRPESLPYGIYTVPEISMVGKTEQELTQAKIPYEVGQARFEELAKGQMLGVEVGLLKILFHPKTKLILGVHVIGESAAEIVHIGQAVLSLGATMDYFRDTTFNYPTFAEAYKVAGLDGLNKI